MLAMRIMFLHENSGLWSLTLVLVPCSFEANPFAEEWSESPDALDDRGKPGVRVRALYAYGGEESDELSFKEGLSIAFG